MAYPLQVTKSVTFWPGGKDRYETPENLQTLARHFAALAYGR